MSTVGEVSPSSFDSYEGIRIVIPGLVGFGTGVAAFSTVAPDEGLGLVENAFVGLVAALVIGLFLYYWDMPARSAAYNENQPTDYLEEQHPEVKSYELLTAYLLLLNTKMPSNTRNRSLYMGSMYRIGVEMILSLGIAVYVVFAASLFDYGPSVDHGGVGPRLISAALLFLVYGFCLAINHGYERRSSDKRGVAAGRIVKSLYADAAHRVNWLYVAGIALMILPNLSAVIEAWGRSASRGLVVFGMALCLGHWAFRYVRGYAGEPEKPKKRIRLHSTSSGLLFIVPIFISLLIYGAEQRSVLGSANLMVAWTFVACLVLMTTVTRGHERKLHGVYRGQTRWLEENPDEMAKVLAVGS